MKRNQDEFINIIDLHKSIIYKICYTYGKNIEDRNDLYQEILIQIWKSMQRYDPKFKMSTWIYRIALNTSISFYRKNKKDDLRDDLDFENVFLLNTDAMSNNPLVDQLYDFINSFDPMNKALMLLYLDDHDHKDIAEIMGLSDSNVGTKISRLKKSLKKRFDSENEV